MAKPPLRVESVAGWRADIATFTSVRMPMTKHIEIASLLPTLDLGSSFNDSLQTQAATGRSRRVSEDSSGSLTTTCHMEVMA